ncbi:hypothetical protein [Sulfobacillus thermosulfidooxidans]|uniref:DUF4064 domain-containing protein n=2 Tax=Sulfobacillus thermosulfidooxidans TaxID=28034 RepID=A0A1W1WM71_SULTA|nr:hypothetical protein [Sulfobacillus thermosulfidooxidans]OLZ09633.1 hypothetical protein BFX05_11775 [Sulfobacillus thermosulfidooxidans]OLZ16061.1 hypothetical protein BFX06_03265 [Sulfobacillus thermosulfidooxidans]OLZ18092.1 hypothetical protein BFX07_06865 [Sulfobacillus thermosulfidooxidans]PSR29834.1 MAG: hypothetical protein C7B47_00565 [Sulfobacillus thermosulfidooxidans]SMC07279.1 hypothetical protein SAMN00768000_3305 [Sulfobacillus thermosulfidooxidans DSM 9293]
MKYLAFVLGILGGITGILAGLFEHIPGVYDALLKHLSRYGLTFSHITVIMGVLGLISGILFLINPRWASWIGLIATVGGAIGSFTLWLLPGSFIFMATVIGFFELDKSPHNNEVH